MDVTPYTHAFVSATCWAACVVSAWWARSNSGRVRCPACVLWRPPRLLTTS